MFSNEILKNNKNLSKVWQASFNCENNSDRETDLTDVCNDLNELVASDAVNYKKRLSLRSSTILIDGATKLLRSKTNQLAEDMFKLNTEIVTRKRKLSEIDEEGSSDLIETPEKIMRATSDLHDITPPQHHPSQLKSIFSPKIAYSHSYCTDDNDLDSQKDSSNNGDVPDELNIAIDSIEELEEDEEELIQMDLTEDIEEELQSTEINTEQSLVDELDNEASSTNEEETESNEELVEEITEESLANEEEYVTEESLPTTEKIPSQNDNSSKTSRETQSAERRDNSSTNESEIKEKTQSTEANKELLTEESLASTEKIRSKHDNSSSQNSDVETEAQSTEVNEELVTEGITENSLPSTEKIQSQNDNSSINNSSVEETQRKEINEGKSLDKSIQKDKNQSKNDKEEESSNNSSVQGNQKATNNIEQNVTEECHKERRLERQITQVDSEELQSQRTTNVSKGKSIAAISVPKSKSNEIDLSKTTRTFMLKKKKSVQKKDQSCQTTDHGVSFTRSMRDRDSNIENLPIGILLIHDTHNSRLPSKLIIGYLNPNVRFI